MNANYDDHFLIPRMRSSTDRIIRSLVRRLAWSPSFDARDCDRGLCSLYADGRPARSRRAWSMACSIDGVHDRPATLSIPRR